MAGKGVFVRADVDVDSVREQLGPSADTSAEMQAVLARLAALEAKVAHLEDELAASARPSCSEGQTAASPKQGDKR